MKPLFCHPKFVRGLSWLLVLLSASVVALAATAEPRKCSDCIDVRPPVDYATYLNNPGRGWESNNRTLTDLKAAEAPPSRVAYFKYYLKTFLREDGSIDTSRLARDLENAKKSGQQLGFRLMIFSEEEGGEILQSFGVKSGMQYRYIDGDFKSPQQWAPDLDDSATQSVLRKLLFTLGKRFDGDPRLSHIDIGYVGLWGEWQTSDTVPRVPMPSLESQKRIIDMHFEAFPSTKKIMQLQSAASVRYALERGAGLRADCLGGLSTTMMRLYPLTLLAAGAQDAWKKAPFIFEICWNLEDWEKRSFKSSEIFSTALDTYHASLINTKSSSIPAAMRDEFYAMLKRLGYRFAITKIQHPRRVGSEASLPLHITFENSGSAPCYVDYRLILRLRSKDGSGAADIPTPSRLCPQLPGSFEFDLEIPLPPQTRAGEYDLGFGVAERESLTPSIQLANTTSKDGWYWLSSLRVEKEIP
ncbi:MAG: DUF4832 domain-containing protein [Deltaproteobacteria bacterium]|nr:DUF4832 domain-containing protein [Deltaproteobacteria bacterium]